MAASESPRRILEPDTRTFNMEEIYISQEQRAALAAIDANNLNGLIEQAILEEQSGGLHRLRLTSCGPYVASRLQHFDRALAKHRDAKAPRKRMETDNTVRRAGRDLIFAIEAMKQRMEIEQKEEQLFHVDGQILPYHFNPRLSARVSYRWRKTIDDEWTHDHITFIHDVDLTPDYRQPSPKRKPSAARQQQEMQEKLSDAWAHLMMNAMYSVRDYFREGRDGDYIPKTYKVKVDPHSRGLNNHSTRFWSQQS